ncbi:tissue inhibitor of metalloproteinase [Bradysia coprophila]|uniref:tissue inhibitor of metalloproteinase n=1 Tax=Bradysia coprophila TaxID=38358 RepID=UPI00187DBBCF|nr:tissue inhibitor of metalloproteinase [Bradysia coprophila]
MARTASYVTVLCVLFIAYLAGITHACMCQPEHPQTKYCKADYVIIARVLRKSVRRENHHDVYKILIKKSYKMSKNANHSLKDGRIITASSESMCGMQLNVGSLYVISGKDNRVDICNNYVKEYSKMTIVERRGFAGGYKKGCLCEINMARWSPYQHQRLGTCNWELFSKCETNYGACVPSRGTMTPEGKPVKCHWRQSPLYTDCIDALL